MKVAATAAALVLLLAVSAHAAQFDQFDEWAARNGKSYPTVEERNMRRAIFFDNLKFVAARNAELKAQGKHQVYNTTIFMDMSRSEFAATHLNYVDKQGDAEVTDFSHVAAPLSGNVDWNAKGVVTAVKNQGQCGSCWAFSATETIESFWALAGNPLTKLSPQQITSCTQTCDGCGGGWPYLAYEYIETVGLDSAASYPYTSGGGSTGICNFKAADIVAHISGWHYAAQNGNEGNLLGALTDKGPISVCVDASTWQFYSGGVLSSNCGQQLDHCVQLTGYKSSFQGQEVWVVRNSWTASWGEQGYIWIAKGENLCGIANAATYVTI